MSYLGQIPQTTRSISQHFVGTGSNQSIAYPAVYKQGYIDVYVNGYRIDNALMANNPNVTYFEDGLIPGTYDGTNITIHGLNNLDFVEIITYSTIYNAGGGGGGGGTIDQSTFNALLLNELNTPNGMQLDGGTY